MGKESWAWEINFFPMFGKSGMGKRFLAHGKVEGKGYNWETKQNLFSIPTQNKHGKGNKVIFPDHFSGITKHGKGINISYPLGNDMGNDFPSNSFREPNGA
ncbi:hypothetical protein Pyn_10459 [Prunus yedoensis var. nudiflora]|uniref:Uncharacterized protein n=1 Tax=Prunus yedoensis var. nudiflora TaxID=2094558 RepID=A0A314ZU93_PRUYE|nr:hypothetical protein Pyn_10459 [Prunus yedoensis var. nudiflora]